MSVVVSGSAVVNRIDDLLHSLKHEKRIDMCRNLGIKSNTVSAWLTRDSVPPVDAMIEIARYLNVSIDYLATGTAPDALPPEYMSFLHDVMSLSGQDFEELKAIVAVKKSALNKVQGLLG